MNHNDTANSKLAVVEQSGQLVVDSRLLAERLGLAHKSFLETIRKYKSEIEQVFGVVPFETAKPLKGSDGGRPETFCYLNEEQASFVMTLSRNTPEVVQCKLELVKAFSEAKKKLSKIAAPELDPKEAFYALLAESRKQTDQMFANIARWQNQTHETVQEHGSRIESHDARLNRIESEQSRWVSPNGDYMSVKGFWRCKGYRLATKDAAKIGSQMTRYCKGKNIKVEPIKDPQFGYVNSYPENILTQFFEQWRNS